jgi:hypothetical protein
MAGRYVAIAHHVFGHAQRALSSGVGVHSKACPNQRHRILMQAHGLGDRGTVASAIAATKAIAYSVKMPREPSSAIFRLPTSEPSTSVPLAANRTLDVASSGASFRLHAPDGTVELSVRVTEAGPVLTFSAASIEIAQTHTFKVDVQRLELRSRDLRLESTGNVEQIVAGNSVTHCGGRHEVQADGVTLISHGDEMRLDSTQDLTLSGERVLINC